MINYWGFPFYLISLGGAPAVLVLIRATGETTNTVLVLGKCYIEKKRIKPRVEIKIGIYIISLCVSEVGLFCL